MFNRRVFTLPQVFEYLGYAVDNSPDNEAPLDFSELSTDSGTVTYSPDPTDILLIVSMAARSSTTAPSAIGTPTGWTSRFNISAIDTNSCRMQIFTRTNSSSETSVMLDGSGLAASVAIVLVFRDTNGSGPTYDSSSATSSGSNSGLPNPPSATPSVEGAVAICAGVNAYNSSTSISLTPSQGAVIGHNFLRRASDYLGAWAVTVETDLDTSTHDQAAWSSESSNSAMSWCAATIIILPSA